MIKIGFHEFCCKKTWRWLATQDHAKLVYLGKKMLVRKLPKLNRHRNKSGFQYFIRQPNRQRLPSHWANGVKGCRSSGSNPHLTIRSENTALTLTPQDSIMSWKQQVLSKKWHWLMRMKTFYLQIQEDQRQFKQRFAWRLRQVGKPSLPDEAFRQNVVEIVFGLLVFLNNHNKRAAASASHEKELVEPVKREILPQALATDKIFYWLGETLLDNTLQKEFSWMQNPPRKQCLVPSIWVFPSDWGLSDDQQSAAVMRLEVTKPIGLFPYRSVPLDWRIERRFHDFLPQHPWKLVIKSCLVLGIFCLLSHRQMVIWRHTLGNNDHW